MFARLRSSPLPRVATHLLQNYPVADLSIDEVGIGTIIEKIMRARDEVVR